MDLEKELQALHKELEYTNLQPYITQKQVKALAILMGKCIENKKYKKEIRIHALNRIAGKALLAVANVGDITSTKNLTGTMAKILLDLFLESKNSWEPSDYAKRLIGALENEFEKELRAGENEVGQAGVAA